MCQSGMSNLRVILLIISLVELCKGFIGYSNNSFFRDYYVTSTDFSVLRTATGPNSSIKNFTCKLQLEEDVIYQVVLQLNEVDVVSSKTNVLIYEENSIQNSTIFKENHFHVVSGYLLMKKSSTSIIGYIKNYSFYGTVFLEKIVYFVEDLEDHPQIFLKFKHLGKNAVVFKDNALNSTTPRHIPKENIGYNKNVRHFSRNTNNNETYIFKSIIGKGKVCSLFILIDNSFLTVIHKGNLKAAAAQVLSALEESNSIFRSTDFDGDGYPDNIGLRIKYMIVLQSVLSPMNLLPKYSRYPIDVNIFMKAFSLYKFLSEVCLGIVFTGHSFKRNVIGGSYTAEPMRADEFRYPFGGICDRPYKFQSERNLNTIAISPRMANDGKMIPKFMLDICLTHEIGHSFGSEHDITSECIGHLMTAYLPEDEHVKRFMFSKCSREIILQTIISKGHCFEDYEGSYCGNGIVEEGEDCDCGSTRDCKAFDVCCVPRGRTNSCMPFKNKIVDCHPSQGLCCNLMCKYENMSKFDLDCQDFDKKCPCSNGEPCSCGVQGECTNDVCSSEECTRISLTECDCPINVIQDKCKTCCWFNDSCVSSDTATKKLITANASLITALNELKNLNESKSLHFGYYRNFCDASVCVELYFREANPNDFCLIHGEVGICNAYFQCTVPNRERIFPSLRIFSNKGVFVPFAQMLLFNFLLLVVCNFLFQLIN